jgi:hypothetical protein
MMEGTEKPLPRGDVEEHYCGVFTEKDVEILGELYDIEYEVLDFGTWEALVLECQDKSELTRKVIDAMNFKLNGKVVDWQRLEPNLGSYLKKFAVSKFKGGGPKNSGGASVT